MSTFKINNKEYARADLSSDAQQQLTNIQAVDAEIAKLQQQLAIYQTARNAYVQALLVAVEPASETKSAPAKKTRATKTKA